MQVSMATLYCIAANDGPAVLMHDRFSSFLCTFDIILMCMQRQPSVKRD